MEDNTILPIMEVLSLKYTEEDAAKLERLLREVGVVLVTKKSSVELVEEFHKVFSHAVGDKPQIPLEKDHAFRTHFLQEEISEADVAYVEKNLVKYADALGDMQYVLDGWFLNAGLQDKKQAIMEEIHKSNMTKACKTIEEAEATIDRLMAEQVPLINTGEQVSLAAYHYEEIDNYFVVKRSSDGKVMKGINYEPPNLKKIIYE